MSAVAIQLHECRCSLVLHITPLPCSPSMSASTQASVPGNAQRLSGCSASPHILPLSCLHQAVQCCLIDLQSRKPSSSPPPSFPDHRRKPSAQPFAGEDAHFRIACSQKACRKRCTTSSIAISVPQYLAQHCERLPSTA